MGAGGQGAGRQHRQPRATARLVLCAPPPPAHVPPPRCQGGAHLREWMRLNSGSSCRWKTPEAKPVTKRWVVLWYAAAVSLLKSPSLLKKYLSRRGFQGDAGGAKRPR